MQYARVRAVAAADVAAPVEGAVAALGDALRARAVAPATAEQLAAIQRGRRAIAGATRRARGCFWHFVGQRALEHLLGWEREGSANCPLATPTVLLGFLLPWMWDISSRLFQQSAATALYFGSGLHARGEGERVLALESREGPRASRRVEEALRIQTGPIYSPC